MDSSSSSCCFVARVNGPRTRFLFAGGKKRAQAKQMINGPNECVHAGVLHAETAKIIQRLLLAEINQLTFQLRADDDCLRGEVVARVLLNRCYLRSSAPPGQSGPLHECGEGIDSRALHLRWRL